MMIKFKQLFIIFLFFTSFLLFMSSDKVLGHSFVVKESPVPNSQLETPPKEVVITFDKKVERELASIKVTNEKQQKVTGNLPRLNDYQKEIALELPELGTGIYKVEYYAVSSNDGHPIRGAYHFNVIDVNPTAQMDRHGTMMEPEPQQPSSEENAMKADAGSDSEFTLADVNLTEWLIYMMRAIYYIGLLLIIGWVFWWRYIKDYSTDLKKKYLFWGIVLQMLHLVGLLSMILIQLNIFTDQGLSFATDFPFGTNFGLMWLVSLLVSLIGFIVLFRNEWCDLGWVMILLLAKSLNGHSLEFEPSSALVLSNSIHLMAASIWASGLTFIIVFWRKQRLYVQSFIPLFSRFALMSMVILSITGFFASIAFLSSFEQLLSGWGIVLLSKVVLVIFVIIIAALIRTAIKKHKNADSRKLIMLDFFLMMAIIILVSILTYLSPISLP